MPLDNSMAGQLVFERKISKTNFHYFLMLYPYEGTGFSSFANLNSFRLLLKNALC